MASSCECNFMPCWCAINAEQDVRAGNGRGKMAGQVADSAGGAKGGGTTCAIYAAIMCCGDIRALSEHEVLIWHVQAHHSSPMRTSAACIHARTLPGCTETYKNTVFAIDTLMGPILGVFARCILKHKNTCLRYFSR